MFLRGCCASSSFVSVKISDFPSESVQTRYYFSDKIRPLGTCFVSSFQTSLDFVTLYPFFSFLAMSRVFLSFTSRGKCGILRSNIYRIILFENLFKPRQLRLAVYMLLTSSVLSTTSKQCFEQPAARFLVCSLIFIEYNRQESEWIRTCRNQ